jgi:hypothetical protein
MSATMGSSGGSNGADRSREAGDDMVRREFRYLGWGILGLVVAATVVLVLLWDSPSASDAQARDLAAELVASLEDAGLQAPDEEVAARVYGTTGGAGCTVSADDVLARNISNAQGTGEVAGRRGLIDPRFVQYERIVLQTYCPERVDDFDDVVSGLRLKRTLEASD